MSRLKDWPERLFAYIERTRSLPFHVTQHNCATFASGAIAAVTGEEPLPRIGVQFESIRDYAEIMRDPHGPRKIVSQHYGEMLPPLLAQRGDLVVRTGVDGDALGICVGDRAAFLVEAGLQFRVLADCEGCWHI